MDINLFVMPMTVIYTSKNKRAGYRVLNSISKFLEKDLKVTVNQKKTTIGSPLRLKFLGFSLGVSTKGYAK